MRKSKKNEKSKSIHYGFYFCLFVIFIIIVSVIFKVFDSVKKSEFDGNNLFSVAVFSNKNAEIISASPEDGTLKKLTINGGGDEQFLRQSGIPYDSLAESKENISDPKSFYLGLLLHKDGLKSQLTTIDVIRLFIYSRGVDGGKVQSDSFSVNDISTSPQFLSEWFLDPQLAREKKNIEITNNTGVSGLGNKFAKIISNIGGNVVLVNTSQGDVKKSVIYYSEESYTTEKLSKMLNIPLEKKELNSISDIIINLGEDRSDF